MNGRVREFRLTNGLGGLGVGCTARGGVTLAGVPLLLRGPGGFAVRPAAEVAALLRRAYPRPVPPVPVMAGLARVAAALNRGDLTQAMIAAVHLRLPDLDRDGAARLSQANDNLRAPDQFAKYSPDQPRDWHGRWAEDGGVAEGDAAPVVRGRTSRDAISCPTAPITPKEREYAKAGDRKAFWTSRERSGDPLAWTALSIVNNSTPSGAIANLRLAAAIRSRSPGMPDLGVAYEVEQIGVQLMQAHVTAVDGKRGGPSASDIADYHFKVFGDHYLPKETFGGAMLTGTETEAEITSPIWRDCP